jgi:hypothetical protein
MAGMEGKRKTLLRLVVVLGNEVEVTTTLLYLPRLAILSLHSADWLCIHCIALATWIG